MTLLLIPGPPSEVGPFERHGEKEAQRGDAILVRAGEVVPVDGVITSSVAMLDEAAVTGEPIPVSRKAGELARSGAVNSGESFELRASARAGESTYAGIVRMASAAQTAKAAVCADGGPLRPHLVARHPDRRRRRLVVLGRSRPSACGAVFMSSAPTGGCRAVLNTVSPLDRRASGRTSLKGRTRAFAANFGTSVARVNHRARGKRLKWVESGRLVADPVGYQLSDSLQ